MTETNEAEPRAAESEPEARERPPSLGDFEGATDEEIAALPPDMRRLILADRAATALAQIDFTTAHLDTEVMRTAFDKSDWGDGPWQGEPDLVMWRAKASPHYPCQVSRNPFGSLCGYVAIPPGHPAHGVSFYDERLSGLAAHGGLTFCGPATADHWVLGFDCGHGVDVQPAMNARLRGRLPGFMRGEDDGLGAAFRYRYRDLPYVRTVVEALAAGLGVIAAAGVLPPVGHGFDDEPTEPELEP
jgi:hypothetical protein